MSGVTIERPDTLVLDLDPQEVGAGARLGADISSPLQFTAVDLVRQNGRPFQAQVIASSVQRDSKLELQCVLSYELTDLGYYARCRKSHLVNSQTHPLR